MGAVTQPLSVLAGSSRTLRVTVTQESDGERLDLTGITVIEFQVKDALGDADPPDISKSIGSGITVLTQSGDTLGQFEITLDPSDTSGLAIKTFKYDVVVVLVSGQRHYVIPPSDFTVTDVVNQP